MPARGSRQPRQRLPQRFYLLAALATALALGCGYVPPVIGQEDVLVILASDEDRPLLEPLLGEVFGRSMATPAPEPYFKVRWASPLEFDSFRRYKSLVIASLSNPADSTGDLLIRRVLGPERIAEARQGGNPIFVATDFFARGQMFMGITALDAIHAQTEIARLSRWIFDRFDLQLRSRQTDIVYRHKPEKKLAADLLTKYQWDLRIQHDYLIVRELPERNFVWLGRGYPYRWLGVHWIDAADTVSLTPEWSWGRMEYVARRLFGAISIDSLFRSNDISSENGHTIFVLRGVWAHQRETAGGPFITYVFRDRAQRRVYFITGIVFNPGGSKALLVRQQEVMIRTFHTFRNPPATNSQSSDEGLT